MLTKIILNKKLYMRIIIKTVAMVGTLFAQVTIGVDDLQYEIGGYYEMYNIPSPQGISGLTGIVGGPYVFDFSNGPTTSTLLIDCVDVNDGGHGNDFPSTTIAERRTDNGTDSYLFMDFANEVGRTIF